MKILTDLGHPKNVHVIKNLIPLLKKKGHEIHVVYREREHIEALLRAYGISGTSRGKGATGILCKLFYLLKTDLVLIKLANRIKPDLLLSFGSPYLANLALFTKIPMIVFDDTEQNRLVQRIYAKTASKIVVPLCFGKELSPNQIRFQGFFELAYLAPRYFQPQDSPARDLGMGANEKIVLLRFVSWQAIHDLNTRGLSNLEKEELVATVSSQARVIISAEGELPRSLEPFRLKLPSELIHHFMAKATLVFSEGATMAAEAAVLGVPTIHCSDLRPGYIRELESRHGLLKSFLHREFRSALDAARDFLSAGDDLKIDLQRKREKMLSESVDVVEMMAEIISQ
jgi:predicted glycosyltransferase